MSVVEESALTRIPDGWFQIGWSTDFSPRRAIPLTYFEQELVAYRAGSGHVVVLDAHCPRCGAHLGYGSRVEGDDIRCPHDHGTRGRDWATAEVDGVVFVCHDSAGDLGDAPAPGGFVRSDEPFWPLDTTTSVWRNQTMIPQFAADNVVDGEHFRHVHGSHDAAVLLGYEHDRYHFEAQYELEFGGGLPSTWATPHGPIRGTIRTEAWGLGVLWNRLGGCDDIRSVLGVTPVGASTCDVRLTVWIPTVRSDGSPLDERIRDLWFAQQRSQVDADLLIWTHQRFVERPPYVQGEGAAMRTFRAYSRGFHGR